MRPLIYVVDLPPIYNARMLQYRIQKETCAWRGFDSGNASIITKWTYQVDKFSFHLQRSGHVF